MKILLTIILLAVFSSTINANEPRNSILLEKDGLSVLVQREQFQMSVSANYQGNPIYSDRIDAYSNYYYEGVLQDFNMDGYLDFLIAIPDEGRAYIYFRLNDKNTGFITGFCGDEHYMLDLEAVGMNFQSVETPRKYSFFELDGVYYAEFYRLHSSGQRNHTYNVRFVYDESNQCFKRITEMPDLPKETVQQEAPWWKFWK